MKFSQNKLIKNTNVQYSLLTKVFLINMLIVRGNNKEVTTEYDHRAPNKMFFFQDDHLLLDLIFSRKD